MRPSVPLLRSPLQAICIAVLSLLAASAASAAPAPGNWGNRVCNSEQTTLKKLLRHPKSYGGPLATRVPNRRQGLGSDLSAHMRPAKRTSLGAGAVAIQNDAPAARADGDHDHLASLRPLGFLVGSVDSHPRTRAFSPRSPRGPPAAA